MPQQHDKIKKYESIGPLALRGAALQLHVCMQYEGITWMRRDHTLLSLQATGNTCKANKSECDGPTSLIMDRYVPINAGLPRSPRVTSQAVGQ